MSFEKRNFEMFLARQQKGFTQKELAEKIRSSANYISKIESNLVNPSLEVKTRIARVLDKDVESIFGKFE